MYIMSNAVLTYWWLFSPLIIIAFLFLPKKKRHDTLTR